MIGNLLLRGMLVGVLAGFLSFGFDKIVGEPLMDGAIAFEEHLAKAHSGSHEHKHEIVSRSTQASIGLGIAIVVYGAAIGGLFSLVFAFAHGRLGNIAAQTSAAILALAGFIAIVLVPGLKYPANPPAVGTHETVESRTLLFFLMLSASIATMSFAVKLARTLMARHGIWNATAFGVGSYVVLITALFVALPGVNEVPEHFPAALLWDFRMASFGIHAVLWTVLGLGFGYWTRHNYDLSARAC
jgi:predicted cobalt transporter CbtA